MLKDHEQTLRISTRGNSATLTIPKPMMHALRLVIGDHVRATVVGTHLVITPVEDAIRDSVNRSLSAYGLVKETLG